MNATDTVTNIILTMADRLGLAPSMTITIPNNPRAIGNAKYRYAAINRMMPREIIATTQPAVA